MAYDRQQKDKSDNTSENEIQPVDEKDSLAMAKRVSKRKYGSLGEQENRYSSRLVLEEGKILL